MYITNKHMSRRAVLKGMGATMALPLLEAMVPARNGVRGRGGGQEDPARRHRDGARLGRQHAVRPQEEPVGARGGRQRRSICRRAC